jgi:16S rRNA (uracil1498-N3)-methyltransferase
LYKDIFIVGKFRVTGMMFIHLPLILMSLPLFFHKETVAAGLVVSLDETNSRHAIQVLRLKPGEQLELTNGSGFLWLAAIKEAGKKSCTVNILSENFSDRGNKRHVGIAISPIKNAGRFEWFLEKATELGVKDIFPVLCKRTEKSHLRVERMQQILISAMLQSRQVWLPQLHTPMDFEALVKNEGIHHYHHRWIAHCASYEKHHLAKALQPGMQDSFLFIGPEGDFTPEEIFMATNGGYLAVSLGDTRLRTETAGMVGAALMCLL